MTELRSGRPRFQLAFALAALAGALVAASLGLFGEELPAATTMTGMMGGLAVSLFSTIAFCRHGHQQAVAGSVSDAESERNAGFVSLALNASSGNFPDWVWETDSEGKLTHASPGLWQGLGLDSPDIIGRGFTGLFADGETGAGWHRLVLAMETGRAITCKVELPLHGTRTLWRITAQPTDGGRDGKRGCRGFARNITAERTAHLKLAEKKRAAHRDGARKSRFLAALSCEMRTPLNTLVGFSELLLSHHASDLSDGERREYLQTMLDSSRQLQGLVNDVLDTTRLENGKLHLVEQEADAAEITEVALKMCRDTAAKAGTTIVASVIDDIELRCDVARLKQALLNLVRNAIATSRPGAMVSVEFEVAGDGGLTIAVTHGLTGRHQHHIFEPFAQTATGTPGGAGMLGLGMPIARQIALLHGGDVTIESIDGTGAITRLKLPATRVTWPKSNAHESSCAA